MFCRFTSVCRPPPTCHPPCRRRSVLVGLGKSLAVIFQGAWLIQIAAVEYESEW